jgi:hypothetical protein
VYIIGCYIPAKAPDLTISTFSSTRQFEICFPSPQGNPYPVHIPTSKGPDQIVMSLSSPVVDFLYYECQTFNQDSMRTDRDITTTILFPFIKKKKIYQVTSLSIWNAISA